jgi:hypothetical protein
MAVYRITFDEGEGHIYRDADTIQSAVDQGFFYLEEKKLVGIAYVEKVERIAK